MGCPVVVVAKYKYLRCHLLYLSAADGGYDRNWRQKRECWNICCAAACCKLRAATNENLCEAKLSERGKFEANLMSHLMWGDVVFNSVKNSILMYSE